VRLETHRLQTVDQVRGFLAGSRQLDVRVESRAASYALVAKVLQQFDYRHRGKADKGLLRNFLAKVTGLSRAQLTRLLAQHRATGQVVDHRSAPRHAFPRRYTSADIGLLAEVDRLHGALSGPATRKLCARAFHLFGDARYERLAAISNGHLYNLRHSTTYRRRGGTAPRQRRGAEVTLGERRRPRPYGRPGHVRVDSVHQGELDGIKGLYHVNLVDEVTQFQFIGSVEHLHAGCVAPLLEALLQAFPFAIHGFHTDNGSEFVNREVAALLRDLHIEFTRSRPCRSTDNALVESKNGAVIRRHLGHGHIPGRFAAEVNAFTQQVLSPYLNYHRPCLFPREATDARGRVRKRYHHTDVMTPYEKLKSLPDADSHLRPRTTFAQLDADACAISDNDAARNLNEARDRLFRAIGSAA